MMRSFVTISGVSGLSLVVGFFQNVAIAAIIGAAASKDAYDIAYYLPRMMLFMFGLDLFKGISISLFSRLDVNKSEDSSKVFSTLLNGVALVSLVAIVVAEVFAGPLVRLIGTGLAPQTSQLAVNLARFLIPTLGLIAVSGLISSILLANHYYGLTEGLVIIPKVTMLVGVLCWGKTLDVWVLVIALIVGLLAELPLMFYFLRRCGLRYSFVLKFNSPAIKSVLIDALPIGIGAIVVYLSQLLLQRTASYGKEGTVACFNYSLLLCGTLATLVSRPASSSLAPRISRSLEAGDYQSSSNMLRKSLGLVVLVCLACVSMVWAEAPIIVNLILGRGRFTPEAVEQTSRFLAIMFMGVLGIGVRMLGIRVLLARRRPKTIMLYCLVSSLVCVVLATAGRNWWGVYASAIAYVAANSIDGLLTILTAIWIVGLHNKMLNPVKIGLWIVACFIVIFPPVMPHLFHPISYTEPLPTKLLHIGIVCVVTGFSFFLAARLIKLYTVKRILNVFKKTIKKFHRYIGPKMMNG
jgi:putative peptidoglycan lipid II flippase